MVPPNGGQNGDDQNGDPKDDSAGNRRKRNPWGPSEPAKTPWTLGKPGDNAKGKGERHGNSANGAPDLDDILRRAHQNFKTIIPGNDGHNPALFIAAAAAILLLWMASGFYFVQSNEHGVVLTFGQYTRTDETPGLKYHLPWPVQNATIVDVTSERRLEIGYNNPTPQSTRGLPAPAANRLEDESLMLTGDENIIDINFVVLWRINNAKDFLYSIREPEDTIRLVASSAMREVIGQTKIQSALTEGRTKVQADTRALMQKILDEYKSGVTINNVQLQKVDPPEAVVDAFNEVQRARQDQVRAQNQAEAYSNSILPVARGESEKLRQQAEAYKQEVINRARGDAARFDAVYEAYKNGADVTAERMYLETLEQVLTNARTVVIGSSNGTNILPYLPLQDLQNSARPKARPSDAAPAGAAVTTGEQ